MEISSRTNQVVNPSYSQHLQCDPEIELQKQTTCEVETILHNFEPEVTHTQFYMKCIIWVISS